MVLMVLETEALSDDALPVGQLAAQMRLAEGYDSVSGQEERLRLRLRSAISSLERRLGKVLIAREVVLCGPGRDSDHVPLPVAPVRDVLDLRILRDGVPATLAGARIEEDAQTPILCLPKAVSPDVVIQATVRAGWGSWDDVPVALAQATLLTAEALDTGEVSTVIPMIETLIAPWRLRRIGGVA